MAKFSLGRDDDSEGPSSPSPKKRRTSISSFKVNRLQQLLDPSEEPVYEEGGEQVASEHTDEEEEHNELDGEGEGQLVSEYQEEGQEEEEGEGLDLGRPSEDGSISVFLTEPDVLDCPICFEPLTIPVFQCENGHIACSSCCDKVKNRCPSCCWPIGYNRCRAIEKVIESIKIPCKYGCKATVSYNKKHDHEETCIYTPCFCPDPDCDFVGSSKLLYVHFKINHANATVCFSYNSTFPIVLENDQKYLILKERTEHTIFALNRGIELLGDVVNVNHIGPRSSKREFSYDLTARNGDNSLRLQSSMESRPRWDGHVPEKSFLLVPSDFTGSSRQLKLEACIRKL